MGQHWKSSLEDPKSQFGKLHVKQWANSSPERRAELVRMGAFSPEGVAHQHIASGYFSGLSDVGKLIGSGLKIAAPLAGLIPGVGIPLGAVLAAGGSAAGGALHGDKFDLGKTALAGVAGGAGAALTGGQGLTSAGLKTAGSSVGLGGAPSTATAATAAGGVAAKPGILGQVWGGITKNPLKAAQIGLGAMSAVQGAKRAGQADQLINRATAPLPSQNGRINLDSLFADESNPYSRPRGTSLAAASAKRSLAGV